MKTIIRLCKTNKVLEIIVVRKCSMYNYTSEIGKATCLLSTDIISSFSSSSSSSSYQPYGILCTKIAFATLVLFKQSILTKLIGLNKVPMPKLYDETFRRRDVIGCHVTMS